MGTLTTVETKTTALNSIEHHDSPSIASLRGQ